MCVDVEWGRRGGVPTDQTYAMGKEYRDTGDVLTPQSSFRSLRFVFDALRLNGLVAHASLGKVQLVAKLRMTLARTLPTAEGDFKREMNIISFPFARDVSCIIRAPPTRAIASHRRPYGVDISAIGMWRSVNKYTINSRL